MSERFRQREGIPHPLVGTPGDVLIKHGKQPTTAIPFTQKGGGQEKVVGGAISELQTPEIFPRSPLQVREHDPENATFAEKDLRVSERGMELLERQVLEHMACVDAVATARWNGQPFDDVAQSHI